MLRQRRRSRPSTPNSWGPATTLFPRDRFTRLLYPVIFMVLVPTEKARHHFIALTRMLRSGAAAMATRAALFPRGLTYRAWQRLAQPRSSLPLRSRCRPPSNKRILETTGRQKLRQGGQIWSPLLSSKRLVNPICKSHVAWGKNRCMSCFGSEIVCENEKT